VREVPRPGNYARDRLPARPLLLLGRLVVRLLEADAFWATRGPVDLFRAFEPLCDFLAAVVGRLDAFFRADFALLLAPFRDAPTSSRSAAARRL
jgi:hypothetical protein